MDYHQGLGVIIDVKTYKLYDTCSIVVELREELSALKDSLRYNLA